MFNILIIDDTKSVHSFVKALLGKCPEIATGSVFNGKEALEHLKLNSNYQMILLDWEMPVMNGPETCVQLRALYPNIPIMMMTTKNAPEDIQKMLESGVVEYLMKPFTIDILFEKIDFATGRNFKYDAA